MEQSKHHNYNDIICNVRYRDIVSGWMMKYFNNPDFPDSFGANLLPVKATFQEDFCWPGLWLWIQPRLWLGHPIFLTPRPYFFNLRLFFNLQTLFFNLQTLFFDLPSILINPHAFFS